MSEKSTKKQTEQAQEEKKPTCGIIMPISAIDGCSAEHWGEVKSILEEAIKQAGYEPNLVSDSNDSGVIQKRIVQNIYDNEIVVCDVSCKNPNVMFELGMRLAFDKPTIVVIDDKTNYTFDTAPIEHLGYPRDLSYYKIKDFQDKLTNKIKGTIEAAKNPEYTTFLKHFGTFTVAQIENKVGGVDEVILNKVQELSEQIDSIRTLVNRNSNTENTETKYVTGYEQLEIPKYLKVVGKIDRGKREELLPTDTSFWSEIVEKHKNR